MIFCQTGVAQAHELPAWVPEDARNYLAHTEGGEAIRKLAREAGCHASTVLRQVRRIETLRDDPLVDGALRSLGKFQARMSQQSTKELDRMREPLSDEITPDAASLASEARRILRRLCESGSVLAVAAEMDKAVVVRDTGDGGSTRTAVVDAPIAQAMALKGWIACDAPGRISRYRITAAGRTALSKLLAEQESKLRGFAEAQAGFDTSHQAEEAMAAAAADPQARRRHVMAESPLILLARRRDTKGDPFLPDDLVRAGERLREDFELAQMGARVAHNWDRFLTGDVESRAAGTAARGPDAARERLIAALRDLGPGLGDVVLQCCCYLEGLETTEKRMGWAARSGKVVLRIALQRLRRHYDENQRPGGGLIG
ncbi:hypothetical protein C357_12644 [Citreicella sp. 357]|nr:hypothetical protein C357_12644 [Citreicella sp. 357]